MMEVTLTCSDCGSGINIHPDKNATEAMCPICQKSNPVKFDTEMEAGCLESCPSCERKDFYKQKDFNRKIGVILFIIAAILSIYTYGISFIVLYLFDFVLHKKLGDVVACYKCNTLFRKVKNIDSIRPFDHEMNDRIIYADHDFEGKPLTH